MAAGPQNPNQAIDMMASITVTHVVLIVVLAVLTVIGIWWGMTLKRRREAAQEQVVADFAAAEHHGATTTATTTPAATVADASGKAPVEVASAPAAAPAVASVPPAATVTPPAESTAPVAEAAPATSDLTQIKGLGPKIAATLAERGITRVAELAALTPAQAAELDAALGSFQGRMARDRWIEQARLLAAGDVAGYEAAFGKLGG